MSQSVRSQYENLRPQNPLEKTNANKAVSFMIIYLHVSVSPTSPPVRPGTQAAAPGQCIRVRTLHFCISSDTAGLAVVTATRNGCCTRHTHRAPCHGPGSCQVLSPQPLGAHESRAWPRLQKVLVSFIKFFTSSGGMFGRFIGK